MKTYEELLKIAAKAVEDANGDPYEAYLSIIELANNDPELMRALSQHGLNLMIKTQCEAQNNTIH